MTPDPVTVNVVACTSRRLEHVQAAVDEFFARSAELTHLLHTMRVEPTHAIEMLKRARSSLLHIEKTLAGVADGIKGMEDTRLRSVSPNTLTEAYEFFGAAWAQYVESVANESAVVVASGDTQASMIDKFRLIVEHETSPTSYWEILFYSLFVRAATLNLSIPIVSNHLEIFAGRIGELAYNTMLATDRAVAVLVKDLESKYVDEYTWCDDGGIVSFVMVPSRSRKDLLLTKACRYGTKDGHEASCADCRNAPQGISVPDEAFNSVCNSHSQRLQDQVAVIRDLARDAAVYELLNETLTAFLGLPFWEKECGIEGVVAAGPGIAGLSS